MHTSSAYSLDRHMYATASSRARARIYARAYIEQHDSMGGMHQLRGVREDPKRERGSGDHQEERRETGWIAGGEQQHLAHRQTGGWMRGTPLVDREEEDASSLVLVDSTSAGYIA